MFKIANRSNPILIQITSENGYRSSRFRGVLLESEETRLIGCASVCTPESVKPVKVISYNVIDVDLK